MQFSPVFVSALYTPLEQFDNVSWLRHRVAERVEPYALSLLPTEFDPVALVSASTLTSRLPFGAGTGLITILLVLAAIVRFLPTGTIAGTTGKTTLTGIIAAYLPGVSHTVLAAVLLLATGGFVTIWAVDLLIPVTDLEGTTRFAFAPQIDRSLAIDETRITFLLAFFLLGAGEERDDEDFLLADGGDLDAVEEVVAPRVLTNLGTAIKEVGPFYLKGCAVFAFVVANNLRGRIPYADTATASLGLTLWTALAVFGSIITLRIRRHGVSYLFRLFRPSGTPFPLLFLLIPIEAISYSFRLVSLAVRLFANRRAGHTLRKVLIGFGYTFLTLGDLYALAAVLPGLVVFVLVFLERAVAVIQAYIFLTLRRIYTKDLYVAH